MSELKRAWALIMRHREMYKKQKLPVSEMHFLIHPEARRRLLREEADHHPYEVRSEGEFLYGLPVTVTTEVHAMALRVGDA